MRKDVDQLDVSTAKEIYKWLISSDGKMTSDEIVKVKAREYLRINKLSPYEALQKIDKQNAGMPKKHCRW